ncbi:hypothetical protein R6Q59_036022 [Mikania micrantha]
MSFATGDGKKSEPSSSSSMQRSCRHFEFLEILIATDDFDESLVIGSGGFGKVYKGNVTIGTNRVVAAIKRLDSMSNQGAAEFWAEVEMLSLLRHCNLVSLIGYCNYEQEMILVYEYMPNRTLNDHLHELRTPLSWLQRLNMCIGAGRGLHYLHTGTGTFGYLDPNYYATGKLTRKSDVYAFGVVLLEVLCRKRAVDKSLYEEQWGLVTWVQDSIKEGNLKNIIDSDIRGEISPKCLKEYVKLAERCLHNSPKHRPTMAEILFSLESVMAIQEKFNNSLQSASRTLFGRMVNLFPFSSNQENSVQGDLNLSTTSKGNDMFPHMKEDPAHFPSQSPILKEFRFSDLEKATRSFSPDLILGEGGFGKAFLAWVKEDTLSPSKQGVGMAVAVKRLRQGSGQGVAEWQAEVNFLGHLAHPNIIRLLGYCREELEHLLVYEYMPNKNFDRFLFSGHLTAKCDIYGLGIVLLESITGRKATDVHRIEGQQSLVEWATRVGPNLKKIMDPRLDGKYPRHLASEYVAVALRCVANNPKDRPSGEEVLQSLEQIYAKQNITMSNR